MPAFASVSISATSARGIDDHAGADDRVLLRAQNAAGNELEHVAILADDDGVAGVVAAGNTRDVVERAGEIVDDLALAFVAPLRADHDDRFHAEHLLARDRGGGIPARIHRTEVYGAKSVRHTNFKSYDGRWGNASKSEGASEHRGRLYWKQLTAEWIILSTKE